MDSETHVKFLSAMVFLPTLGALALAFFPREKTDVMKFFTLAVTAVVAVLAAAMLFKVEDVTFDIAQASMQKTFSLPWIPSFNINYLMGIDGISFPLVVLTAWL